MYENSKKIFTVVYDLSQFEAWQVKRIPMLCDRDYWINHEEGILYLEVYEKCVTSTVNGVRKKWGISPMCVVRFMKGNAVHYPIP
jgi:hypothetical protein